MTKVTMIIGEPAVGKSLLIKELMRLDQWKFMHIKWTPMHIADRGDKGMSSILGRYDEPGHKYPGTDRLSMAVQPRALARIQAYPKANYLFEGDRLGNLSMVKSLLRLPIQIDLEVIQLWLPQQWLDKRRTESRQDQNQLFWKSRHTKIFNLMRECVHLDKLGELRFKQVEHTNLSDTHNLIAHLRKNRI